MDNGLCYIINLTNSFHSSKYSLYFDIAPRPLKRGISKIIENENLVSETRTSILQDITEDVHEHMYRQTFILPDLTAFSAAYRAFLEKDLIETSTLVSLEQAGIL